MTEDIVRLLDLDGREYLFYSAMPVQVALIRGTTADPDGNLTMEKEALTLEVLAIALATHNSEGWLISSWTGSRQWSDAVNRRAQRQRDLPGVLVDCVVIADGSGTTFKFTQYLASVSPDWKARVGFDSSVKWPDLDERKINARRAALESAQQRGTRIGMPVAVAKARADGLSVVIDLLTLTAEPGVIGGVPAGGQDGAGRQSTPKAILDQPYQFDFYDGAGLRHGQFSASSPTVSSRSSDQSSKFGRNGRGLAFSWNQPEHPESGVRRRLPAPGHLPLTVAVADKCARRSARCERRRCAASAAARSGASHLRRRIRRNRTDQVISTRRRALWCRLVRTALDTDGSVRAWGAFGA